MEPDYAKLGTKIGIEIHQELNTKKLFCECSSSMGESGPVSEAVRKLRAVAGETGHVDIASQYEFLRNRTFIYHGYRGEFCMVDLDCEPPHPVNADALRTGVGFAKLIGLSVPEYVCVMRKSITDGSSVSGFQRTMLIGTETGKSYLETSNGRVHITQLSLEEDSCKIEKKEGDMTYYSLSRQGIPLLEVGTDPSIKDPLHAKETALLIGTMLRSFPTVKRGIGTIRQDVNISIAGGARVEVKGWQDIRTLPKLVENEVLRQASLLEIRDELHKRGLSALKKNSVNATGIFSGTKNRIIRAALDSKGVVYALLLPEFSGLLKKELCPGKTFGRELSDYAKSYGTKGMIHTDEDLKKYGLEDEFAALGREMKAGSRDLIIVIAESPTVTEKAVNAVYERALYALRGVPEETRIPNYIDATTSYARPLPGAHRMYPETDIPNIPLTQDYIDSIELPEPLNEKTARISKEYGIDEHMVREMIRESIDIEDYSRKYPKIPARFIAETLVNTPKEIKKRYDVEVNAEEFSAEIFGKLSLGEISREAVIEILAQLGRGEKVDYSKYRIMSEAELKTRIRKIIDENKGLPFNAMIGKVMSQLRGKADGQKIVETLKSLLPAQ